jgi:hypothetical protein
MVLISCTSYLLPTYRTFVGRETNPPFPFRTAPQFLSSVFVALTTYTSLP